jgi:hypothetical protein
MPKEITHLVVADEVLASLSREVRNEILRHRHLYDIGSTSPDLFYYDVPFPFEVMASMEVFSERIHGRSGEDNAAHVLWMLDELKRSPVPGDSLSLPVISRTQPRMPSFIQWSTA